MFLRGIEIYTFTEEGLCKGEVVVGKDRVESPNVLWPSDGISPLIDHVKLTV